LTRQHDKTIVHLGLRDWLVLAAVAIPLVGSYMQLSIAFARVEANQTHILDRLERMEDRE
jgi:hypothetical protein